MLRPDFAFAAAVVLLGVAATFGVVVGPPRPVRDAAAPGLDAARAVVTSPRIAPTPPVVTSPRVAGVPTPSQRTETPRADSLRSDSSAAPSEPRVATGAPIAPGPAIALDRARVIARAPGRSIRVVRAASKRPVMASYRPVVDTVAFEVVSAPEPPVVAAAPIVWRASSAALNSFQAP